MVFKYKQKKKELEKITTQYLNEIKKENKTLQEEKENLQKTYFSAQELIENYSTINNNVVVEQPKLERTLEEAKNLTASTKELTTLIQSIEKKYESEITDLKMKNKQLLEQGSSLKNYAEEISKDKSKYVTSFIQQFASALDQLDFSEYNNGNLGRAQNIGDSGAYVFFDKSFGNKKHDAPEYFNDRWDFYSKNSSPIAISISYADRLSFPETLKNTSELEELTNVKFFEIFLEQHRELEKAKEHAQKVMTPENESKYVAILEKKDSLRIKEVFDGFVPDYKK